MRSWWRISPGNWWDDGAMDATTIPRPFDPADGFLRLTRMAQWIFDLASITLAVLLVLTIIVIAVDRGMLRVPFIERWIDRKSVV